MEQTKIALWEEGKIPFYDEKCHRGENEGTCTLTPYLVKDGKKHAAVIVFPGGGYVHRSEKEGAPVAEYLNSIGLHAFVLNYRVGLNLKNCTIYDDLARSIEFILNNSEEFNINTKDYGSR